MFFGHKECWLLVLLPGIKPSPHSLEGKVLTTRLPGKSPKFAIKQWWIIWSFPFGLNSGIYKKSGLSPFNQIRDYLEKFVVWYLYHICTCQHVCWISIKKLFVLPSTCPVKNQSLNIYIHTCVHTHILYFTYSQFYIYTNVYQWEYQTTWPASWEICMQVGSNR